MASLTRLVALLFLATLGGCSSFALGDRSADAGALNAFSTQVSTADKDKAAPPQVSASKQDRGSVQKVALSLTAVSDPESKSYKIGPGDVLEITVFKVAELSKTVQVSEAGTINYPLIGEVGTVGKTAREVEQILTKSLGAKYLQRPQITVFVKEHNSQRVTIEGAVKKPGVYPIAGGLTLLQAIAKAEGFNSVADETVIVFRQVDGKRTAARFDVGAIRSGKAQDLELLTNDVIVVPTSDMKEGVETVVKFLPLTSVFAFL